MDILHKTVFGEMMKKNETSVIVNGRKFEIKKKPCYELIKRAFDIMVSLLCLILFFWIFILIAVAIRMDDGGPAFYVSKRVGKYGKEFSFYKFRSMKTDADETFEQIKHRNETKGDLFKIKNDPRITRIGKILRRTSLDEFPQIINILKGDMSFVGPRPPLPREVANYSDEAFRRLSIIGGLTCYWQIRGRSEIDFEGMLKLDCQYIEDRSIWTDLKILALTIPAVFRGNGAY